MANTKKSSLPDGGAAAQSPNSTTPSAAAAPDLSIVGSQITVLPSGYTQKEANDTATGSSSNSSPSDSNNSSNNGDSHLTPTHRGTGVSEQKERESSSSQQAIINQYARFRSSPLDWLREISVYVSGEGWRSYDHPIGQPVFYPGYTEQMKMSVLRSPLLQAKIHELTARRVDEEEAQGLFSNVQPNAAVAPPADGTIDVRRREERRREIDAALWQVLEKMTDDMMCKMESKRVIRSAYYVCSQLLTRAYHGGIHVSSEEIVRLRAAAQQAAKRNQSIIFLPCHKSHVDYVSLQVICYRLGVTLPIVVAGDNLNFPLVGNFLQRVGAMWIRRSFGEDKLYSTLVQSYIDTLLQKGYNFECFIEGGRSRTGKLLPPKFGILSFLMESVVSGRVSDAWICPVSTQYDKVIEVDSYISELLGTPKKKENLQQFLSASSVLSLKLGRVDVRFQEPWSMRDFIVGQLNRLNRPQHGGLHLAIEPADRIKILRTMGYKVLSDINEVSVVMPTALVGTVLLTLRGRGVGKVELIRRTEWLCDRIRKQGGRVAYFAGSPTEEVVDRALQVLGPELVGVVDSVAEATYYAVDRFQLSFYRNMTIHLFISEALVSAGLYMRVKGGGGPVQQRMSYDELLRQVQFLSQLFRGQFIFSTEGLDANLNKTLTGLEAEGTLTITRDAYSGKIVEWVELSAAERQRGRENYDFYCFLIWPFIESSWLGAVSLMMLTPLSNATADAWFNLSTVQNYAQLLGKTFYHQGDLSYFEAVNKETLKNSFDRFEEEGIILVAKSKDNRTPTTVKIAPEWMPRRDAEGNIMAEGRLWEFADTISQSRREGKNRRDGATVQTRVLTLADQVGRDLFASAVTATSEATHSVEETMKLRKRKLRPVTGSSDSRPRL